MLKTLLCPIAFVSALLAAGAAVALEKPQIPASAQKLDAAGIMKLYDGSRASFNNLQNDVTLTGEIFYDLKAGGSVHAVSTFQ